MKAAPLLRARHGPAPGEQRATWISVSHSPPALGAPCNDQRARRTWAASRALTVWELPGVLSLSFGCFMPSTEAGTWHALTDCLLDAWLIEWLHQDPPAAQTRAQELQGLGTHAPLEVVRALQRRCLTTFPPEASGVQSPWVFPLLDPRPRHVGRHPDAMAEVVPETSHFWVAECTL